MCPLCHASTSAVLERIPYDAIYQALSDDWSAPISPHVRERLSPGDHATLVRCDSCGLEHFDGAVPGDNEFYAELTSAPAYYEHGRWEFPVVTDRLAPGSSVVDFGAGRGDFLQQARTRASRIVGVDQSPEAITGLTTAGIEAHAQPFRAFAQTHPGEFDVATGFHIIEHVPDVAELVEPMAAVLRPGGRLFVSTPNRHRPRSTNLEPLDCPPHHLSRWSPTQMEHLAERFGLHLVGVSCEPAPLNAYLFSLRRKIPGPASLGRVVAAVARRLPLARRRHERLRRTGELERRGIVGLSMLAEYVKD